MASISQFDQEKFNDFILENSIIQFLPEPIEVADGRRSHIDIAWQPLFEDPHMRDLIADQIICFINNLGFVPDIFKSASPDTDLLISTIQQKWDTLRGQVGGSTPENSKAIVIHDTTILGRMVMGGVEIAQKNGTAVICAISLIDRNELRSEKRTASQFIASYGIPYYAMSGLIGLLPKAFKRYEPAASMLSKEDLATAIEVYCKQYGAQQIKLSL